MARYIALLRAVNVGGTGKLPMADLRAALESAGYSNVRTLLASGNVVLDAARTTPARLEAKLEALLADTFGLKSAVMVRTPEEWTALIDANPMPSEAETSPSAFIVYVMKAQPHRAALAAYLKAYSGPEQAMPGERCIYIHYPENMGQSKFALPKAVGAGTARNWNTVRKLADLAANLG